MIIRVNDDYTEMLLKAMDSFIRHNDEYQSSKQEVLNAVHFSMMLEKERGNAVSNYNVEPESDDVDPADKPVPKGHYQPLGSEPKKIHAD